MAVIKVQKAPKSKVEKDDVIARFCFYFPQYKYSEAKKLPYKRIKSMLDVAQKERAIFMYELTQIVAAPNTKKGSGVKKMLEYYKGIIK